MRNVLRAIAALALTSALLAKQVDAPVKLGRSGKIEYTVGARGDRVVDFSHAGYRGGGVALPQIAARVRVAPAGADDGARIQAALDYVASLPADENGFRGAVQLEKGRFQIADRLRLNASGVVLRGSGAGEDGTVLVALGTSRRALIEIGGKAAEKLGAAVRVADDYVPAGATTLKVAAPAAFTAGETVIVERPSTKEWIAALGMDDAPGRQPFEWKPSTMNVRWERHVTAVAGDTLTLDAPLTLALDTKFGGGTVRPAAFPGRVAQAGVENLRGESPFDATNPCDEEHAWTAVHIEAAHDVWVADVAGAHFAGSLVYVSAAASRVTVQDCASFAPVSENGGFRRWTFHTAGQQTLFLRCRTERGRNDFTTGHLAAGPNVFLECVANEPRSFSGGVGSWASGVLFDNVRIDGASLRLDNLETWNQGVGWTVANSMLWQSTASTIVVRSPPGAGNWAVGPWAQFVGDGRWADVNEFVRPDSLYVAQLGDRGGAPARAALEPRRYPAAANIPSLETAVPELAARLAPKPALPGRPLQQQHGWLVAAGRLLVGTQASMTYWRGSTLPARAAEIGFSISRFVPDRSGTGLTDDLAEVADAMQAHGQVALRHHWGLWYDRRRDDHEMISREDGDVWPPFYEQPWARSGRDRASNGLSRYDLSRYNAWYFSRVRDFAGIARERGLVLINEMFFQHNILEAGAHWAEFPWRTANNVNQPGFPEPPIFLESDGSAPSRPEYGKRIFVAPIFYDVTDAGRRALLRAYIRQCLANLAGQPNVIHTLGDEFSGPRHFVEFWLDVVAEWERETGKQPLIGLSAPKDVQDAILADPVRSRLVDVIDLKYWWRTEKDELFAPKGGENLSPRQHERLWKGGKPTAKSIAGMVAEYRRKFPEKAVLASFDNVDGWAIVAAGGSLPKLPATTDARLLAALARMKPPASGEGERAPLAVLAESPENQFIYARNGGEIAVDVGDKSGALVAYAVDLKTGALGEPRPVAGGRFTFAAPEGRPAAVWITRAK